MPCYGLEYFQGSRMKLNSIESRLFLINPIPHPSTTAITKRPPSFNPRSNKYKYFAVVLTPHNKCNRIEECTPRLVLCPAPPSRIILHLHLHTKSTPQLAMIGPCCEDSICKPSNGEMSCARQTDSRRPFRFAAGSYLYPSDLPISPSLPPSHLAPLPTRTV